MKRTLLIAGALLACLAACAFPAAASATAAAVGMAQDVATPSLLLAVGAAAVVAGATRMPQVGDAVTFHAGENDPAFPPGSRLDAEITHVWGETCVNVVITDAAGEQHSRTSVRLLPEGSREPVGYFATYKTGHAETATG